jgi:hypothetical protein
MEAISTHSISLSLSLSLSFSLSLSLSFTLSPTLIFISTRNQMEACNDVHDWSQFELSLIYLEYFIHAHDYRNSICLAFWQILSVAWAIAMSPVPLRDLLGFIRRRRVHHMPSLIHVNVRSGKLCLIGTKCFPNMFSMKSIILTFISQESTECTCDLGYSADNRF